MKIQKAYKTTVKIKNSSCYIRVPDEFDGKEVEILIVCQEEEKKVSIYEKESNDSRPLDYSKMSPEEFMLRGPALSDDEVKKLQNLKKSFTK